VVTPHPTFCASVSTINTMIELVQADITTLDVDAIVNAANSSLAGGGGVDGAIHRAAGPELVRASMALAPCAAGDAAITLGFRLRARYVIHAVGPIWAGGARNEAALLRSAYDRAFALARKQGDVRSIAFPAISTGVYRFPKELAATIALDAMRRYGSDVERIVACVFDRENLEIYQRLLGAHEAPGT
jgi:O-acetyl-ADP-ribose deacetylase